MSLSKNNAGYDNVKSSVIKGGNVAKNAKFTPLLFKDELFDGKFLLDDKCKVLKYEIRKI